MASTIEGDVSEAAKTLLKKLRIAVTPKKTRGSWLKHLSDKQLAEVFYRLRRGQSASHIAKIAMTEWGVSGASAKSLARPLRDFKTKILPEIQLANQAMEKAGGESKSTDLNGRAKRVSEKLDSLGRMAWLIEEQTDRFVMLREKEKQMKMPLKQTDTVFKALVDSLDQYTKLQIELGILDSKPSEHTLTIHSTFSGVMEQIGERGSIMVAAANNLAGLIEEATTTLEYDPETGVYVLDGEIVDMEDDAHD
jgi:hypothetical protein